MRAWLGILALGATLIDSSRADACSGDPELGITTGVLPAFNSLAPRNTKIWIPSTFQVDLDPADVTVYAIVPPNDVMQAVATMTSAVLVDGEVQVPVVVVEPLEPFVAGTRVFVDVRGARHSEFIVGSDVDLTPPAAPRIERVDVVGGYFGGFSCPESARATVEVDVRHDLLALTHVSATAIPSAALAIGHGDRVRAVDLAEGDHSLHLLAIDLAGNVTATPVPEFTVPTEQSGCSTGRGAGWLPFALLVLVTAFARSGSRCARSGGAARRARRTDRGCSTAR